MEDTRAVAGANKSAPQETWIITNPDSSFYTFKNNEKPRPQPLLGQPIVEEKRRGTACS